MISFFNNYQIHLPYTTCRVAAQGEDVYWVHPHVKCKIQKIQLDFITSSLLPFRYCFRISNLSDFLVTRELHLLLPTALRMRHVRVCDLRKLLDPLLYFCATPPPPLAIPGYGPVALFTKILTINYARKRKLTILFLFTKILTRILAC